MLKLKMLRFWPVGKAEVRQILPLFEIKLSPPCNVVPKCFFNTATSEARNSATKHSTASDRLLDVSWRLSGSFCKIQEPNNALRDPQTRSKDAAVPTPHSAALVRRCFAALSTTRYLLTPL